MGRNICLSLSDVYDQIFFLMPRKMIDDGERDVDEAWRDEILREFETVFELFDVSYKRFDSMCSIREHVVGETIDWILKEIGAFEDVA